LQIAFIVKRQSKIGNRQSRDPPATAWWYWPHSASAQFRSTTNPPLTPCCLPTPTAYCPPLPTGHCFRVYSRKLRD